MNIGVEDLCFSYNDKRVLDEISLEIVKGEVLGILGPNGCGKTTLLKHLNKNLKPESGCVFVGDRDIADLSKKNIAKKIAVVPQGNDVKFAFTVRDIVSMGRMPFIEQFGGESETDNEIIENSMLRAGISDLADRYINTMSGGERQKAIIARALAQTPEILLMDEPTLHLDISHQIDTLELVKKLSADDGLTVVIVSHDLPLVAKYCDRILMLKDHHVFAHGKPEDVLTGENMREVFNIDAVYEFDHTLGYNSVKVLGSYNKHR